jgi:hypothetical protein
MESQKTQRLITKRKQSNCPLRLKTPKTQPRPRDDEKRKTKNKLKTLTNQSIPNCIIFFFKRLCARGYLFVLVKNELRDYSRQITLQQPQKPVAFQPCQQPFL